MILVSAASISSSAQGRGLGDVLEWNECPLVYGRLLMHVGGVCSARLSRCATPENRVRVCNKELDGKKTCVSFSRA